MLIDTHCHLRDPAFAGDLREVIARMHVAGVERAVVVESVLGQLDETLAWAGNEPGIGIATGCHPHDASAWGPAMEARLTHAWHDPAVVAAGEMGLDYHYDNAPREVQQNVFAEQLSLAVGADLPVVIHAREADDDIVSILHNEPHATVILHSFSSGKVLRAAALDAGWYVSFSGMITFKSWAQADMLRAVAGERLLVETDAPYLAPVPHRGKRNEPAWVAEVARKLAEVRGVPFEGIAAVTSANAMRVFWKSR